MFCENTFMEATRAQSHLTGLGDTLIAFVGKHQLGLSLVALPLLWITVYLVLWKHRGVVLVANSHNVGRRRNRRRCFATGKRRVVVSRVHPFQNHEIHSWVYFSKIHFIALEETLARVYGKRMFSPTVEAWLWQAPQLGGPRTRRRQRRDTSHADYNLTEGSNSIKSNKEIIKETSGFRECRNQASDWISRYQSKYRKTFMEHSVSL